MLSIFAVLVFAFPHTGFAARRDLNLALHDAGPAGRAPKSSDCTAPDPRIVEDCADASLGALSPACAANAVRLIVAQSMKDPADKYGLCLQDKEPIKIVEDTEDIQGSADMRNLMLKYVQALPDGTEQVHVAEAPSDSSDWRMVDKKGSGAGGASKSQLFRSKNRALWLKTADDAELASWRSARASYSQLFIDSVRDGAPHTFLARILGIYIIDEGRCPEQCWVAMLDVVPNVKRAHDDGGKNGSNPLLTCDVKPHAISASPRSYSALDSCGGLLHKQFQLSTDGGYQNLLHSAQADMCWLADSAFVDFSWLFAEAEEGAIGAIKVKGSWWHIGVIDFFMGYGWESHGLQGLGRQLESRWKAFWYTKVLPKGPYSNQVWVDPLMYRQGKFSDYSAKQFQVFKAFVACAPAKDQPLVCASSRIHTWHDDDALTPPGKADCDDSDVPFELAGAGLGQTFAIQRKQQCQKEVEAICKKIYERHAHPFLTQMSNADNSGQRSAIRNKIRSMARPEQLEMLRSELKQTKAMEALECVWNGQGRTECGPDNQDSWISSDCILLHEDIAS